MNTILKLIEKKEWNRIYQEYSSKEVIESLTFKEGMLISYLMLFNEQMDDELSKFAVNLIEEIQKIYPNEWKKDWRNEVFLGDAYYFILKYEDRFNARL